MIKIKGLVVEALKDELKSFNIEYEKDYQDNAEDSEVELSELTQSECERLLVAIEQSNLKGTKVVAADIRKYLKAAKQGVESVTARTVRQAAWMLERYIAGLEHHVIFNTDEYGGSSHSGYLVTDVNYRPEERRSGSYIPEAVEIELAYIHKEVRQTAEITLLKEQILLLGCKEILEKAGYVPETPELIAKLEKETVRFYEVCEKVGKQFTAVGLGFDNLTSFESKSRSRKDGGDSIRLDNNGVTCRVVVDVLNETDDEDNRRGRDASIDPYRWHEWNMRFFSPSEEKLARHLEADEDSAELPDVLVPVHPTVPVFDLKRHLRLTVHVNNLTEYVYNKDVAKNLVLPARDWRMVNLLVDHSRNFFQDIVSGKGQSMNILSGGAPGTGKTATAEVFAEFKERPLYTAQCSQLGIDAESVELELANILQRANRWNAVLLLDEADVYIRKRGQDVNQNAIVGAFLRVLEYASCILFMTTNLPDEVDDAIASRCIAKLTYTSPNPEDQVKIWFNLARLNGIELEKSEIKKISIEHPKLSGRDVKNLLKLASFIANGSKVTAATIEEAMLFKPTA